MLIQTQVTELITIYVFSTTLSQDETKGATLLQTDTLNSSYDGHLTEVYISVVTGLDQEYHNYLLDKYLWTRKASHTVWEGRLCTVVDFRRFSCLAPLTCEREDFLPAPTWLQWGPLCPTCSLARMWPGRANHIRLPRVITYIHCDFNNIKHVRK